MYTVEYDRHATKRIGATVYALVDPAGIDLCRSDTPLCSYAAALLGKSVTRDQYPTTSDLHRLARILNTARFAS